MSWLSELTDGARDIVNNDDVARSRFVAEQEFIPTREGVAALQWLSYLRRTAYGTQRPRNQHVVAEPGMGKSRLLRHYLSQFEPLRDEDGVLRREVILVEAPEDGEITHVRQRLAVACFPGLDPNAKYSTQDVSSLLIACGVKQVLFDEMGNILNGSRLSQQKVLALVKSITNIGITVGIATTDGLRLVLAADPQLRSRFHVTKLNLWEETNDLRSFLSDLERQLPFPQPSHLASEGFVRQILSKKQVSTSDILDPIRDACRLAFSERAACISLHHLQQAMDATFPPGGGLEVLSDESTG